MKKEQSAKLLKEIEKFNFIKYNDLLTCLLYTSDAADEQRGVYLGGNAYMKRKQKELRV